MKFVLHWFQHLWNRFSVNILSILFLLSSLLFTTVMISLSHERVPTKMKPLPDVLQDMTIYNYYLIIISELYITLQNICFFIMIIFHPKREIIFRRFLFILGILYYFRAFLYSSTQLPIPHSMNQCLPKLNNTISTIQFTRQIFKRALSYSLTLGFVTQQSSNLCGDYIYSGHTAVIIIGDFIWDFHF